jgi:hypothetical protein
VGHRSSLCDRDEARFAGASALADSSEGLRRTKTAHLQAPEARAKAQASAVAWFDALESCPGPWDAVEAPLPGPAAMVGVQELDLVLVARAVGPVDERE